MTDFKGKKELKKLLARYIKASAKLDKAGGPEKAGELFEECISLEEEILALFELTPTQDNLGILQSFVADHTNELDMERAISVLSRKREIENSQNKAPLEILLSGISKRESAANILPRIGFINHAYTIFLYHMIEEHPELVVDIYNEMQRSKDLLGDIAMLKFKYDELREKNIQYLNFFLAGESII